jgi:hypothetical protein
MTNIVSLGELTPKAKTTLINVGSSRMGAVIPQGTPAEVIGELARHGLIGTCDGLTKAGQILRERALTEALEF